MTQPAFKFPDEQQNKDAAPQQTEEAIEIEVVDDTPPEDRGREPLPKEVVQELEDDDLEEYSDKVKKRLSQMKKVWHDERREKEAAKREAQEALRLAQAHGSELKRLREQYGAGEKTYIEQLAKASETEVKTAKEQLQRAYEEGDPAKIADAQEALTDAKIKFKEAQYRRPSLQAQETPVETQSQDQAPQTYDPKAESWRAKNEWFGVDDEMTSLALGLHNKLVRQGVDPRTDDYYRRVDEVMRKRFPEYFGEEPKAQGETDSTPRAPEKPRKPATVVAPATRSTAPSKVRLSQTQMGIAKKLNLTPEQYARELIKLENANG